MKNQSLLEGKDCALNSSGKLPYNPVWISRFDKEGVKLLLGLLNVNALSIFKEQRFN